MTNISNYWAIVPAAGVGKRMKSHCPKQYLSLLNKPVLQHTLEKLSQINFKEIIVAISEQDEYFADLQLPSGVQKVNGGAERCHSVFNGLLALQDKAKPQDWVLVHDAARPCVRVQDVENLIKTLKNHPVGGLLAVPVRDTMKRTNSQGECIETVSRELLWHALTPQMFRFEILFNALNHLLKQQQLVTDEAQAIELAGFKPLLIEGAMDNLKITHPQDLKLAELFLQAQKL